MKKTYTSAFTLIGLGIGFFLWWSLGSIWLLFASMFLFMGLGVIADTKRSAESL
ncbi:multidrug transporter [Archaeoglobus sp.]